MLEISRASLFKSRALFSPTGLGFSNPSGLANQYWPLFHSERVIERRAVGRKTATGCNCFFRFGSLLLTIRKYSRKHMMLSNARNSKNNVISVAPLLGRASVRMTFHRILRSSG
jgi:hypothetical protein